MMPFYCASVKIDFYPTVGVLFCRSIFKEDNVAEDNREMTR